MEISRILTADVLDIIFEGKNKEYGAYDLRKTYSRRLSVAITVMVSLVLLLIVGYVFGKNSDRVELAKDMFIPDQELVNVEPPEEKIELPPLPEKKLPEVATIQSTPPLILRDDQVPPDEMPPTVDELSDNVKISTITRQGDDYVGIVAPPSDDAVKNGIVVEPKRANPDSLFLKVEIESTYPGGRPAWERFLNKNLTSSYPQEAIDNRIQGMVVVQFIVDREGNVSDVEAVSGPQELREPAVKVIRKSGKWNPAQQNTMKVKSYKRQPIVFQLADE